MTDKKRDIDAIAGERWFPKESTFIDDMKDLWGDWGVCSEVDQLKAVLMRRPGKTLIGRKLALKRQSIRKNFVPSMTVLQKFTELTASTFTTSKSRERINLTRCFAETWY